jgi:hypothetical protein
MPDFVRDKVPVVAIGSLKDYGAYQFQEPRFDHPEFQKAFRELVELLAAEFDSNPLIEWIDLMQYGFWGESHTGGLSGPFPDQEVVDMSVRVGAWLPAILDLAVQTVWGERAEASSGRPPGAPDRGDRV